MGDHDTPASGEGVLGGLDRLGKGTDLVDLQEKGVARLELDGLLDADWVGDSQVITDNLSIVLLGEVRPGLPVILGEWVLDGDNWVLGGQIGVHLGELLVGDPLALVRLWVLEVQVVLLLVDLVELGRGDIHGDVHASLVAGSLDGIGDELKSLLSGLNIWSDTTLVTDVAGGLSVTLLGEGLEGLVDLSSPAHGLSESWGGGWDDHELLESETSTSVGTAVQDVHEWDWENVWLLGASEVRDVGVEWDVLLSGTGLSDGKGDTEDGVGTKLGLVWGSIELDEEVINGLLVLDVNALLDESWADNLVDVLDSLEDTLSSPLGLVSVTELASLVLSYAL